MAKKRAKFSYTDGVRVELDPAGLVRLRVPMGLRIMPKEKLVLKLGLLCDRGVHVFSPQRLTTGLRLVAERTFAPGLPLDVEIENISESALLLERGDTVALGFVLGGNEDMTLE